MNETQNTLIKDVEEHLRKGEKKKAVERITLSLKNAITNHDNETEQMLLWTTVAILEYNSVDYEKAAEQHPAVTKLSQLYALIEELGRMRYPRLMRMMGRQ